MSTNASAATAKRFFRADQVGSLLRPPRLLEARKRHKAGATGDAELRRIEDECIAEAVRLQERIGLPVVTDGEFRRENWWIDFIARIGGVEIRDGDQKTTAFVDRPAWHYVPKNVVIKARLTHPEAIYGRDYAHLKSAATRPTKMTIPSPTRMHFHGGRRHVATSAYPDMEAFFADVARVYQEEIAALEALGCRYIQVDDPLLTYFISDKLREEVRENGEDPDGRLARYVRLVNDCIARRRANTLVGIHLCRGNSRSAWIAEGGYERIAAPCFAGLAADAFLLEYDDERSGDFNPLRYVPKGKKVVLGLITTKHGRLESPDDLRRRIDAAAKYVPLADLAISPQCGFASVVDGNIITPEDQTKKLELVVATADRVWGGLDA
jgi:5-methyltetrahydropteroyltriglutamate--homocysteine methyltransferase